MIKEEYCTKKTFELLKQVGYPSRELKNQLRYYIPTQTQAMRWLREKRGLFVRIAPNMTAYNPAESCYWEVAKLCVGGCDILEADIADTYEHAAEAGIQAACICLIRNNQP